MDKKNRQSSIVNRQSRAFTLVEVLIVVAILGILAAIVMPEVHGYTQKAKEAAAKDNLRILRETIARYAAEHKDVPPGYQNGDKSSTPNALHFMNQFCWKATNASGQTADIGTPGYPYKPYLPEIPTNPFNGKKNVIVIQNSTSFPTAPTRLSGWLYKPSTNEIRLDADGTDSEGVPYFEY